MCVNVGPRKRAMAAEETDARQESNHITFSLAYRRVKIDELGRVKAGVFQQRVCGAALCLSRAVTGYPCGESKRRWQMRSRSHARTHTRTHMSQQRRAHRNQTPWGGLIPTVS